MLELIVVFFLAKHIGQIVEQKGHAPGKWKAYVWGAWFASEIGIMIVGMSLLGLQNLTVYVAALIAAFVGYSIVRQKAMQLPNIRQDDFIDQLGQKDYY